MVRLELGLCLVLESGLVLEFRDMVKVRFIVKI